VFTKLWRFGRHYWQLSLALAAAIVSLGFQLFGPDVVVHWLLGLVSLILAVPIIVEMWEDLRTGRYGIDILAVTAIITSVLLRQYWAAIVIVIMFTGGEALEDYAERRAHAELDALLKRAPQQAHVLRGRKVLDIKATEVHVSDKIIIKAGEVVPVDTVILEGTATFDESSLTGESVPVVRQSRISIETPNTA